MANSMSSGTSRRRSEEKKTKSMGEDGRGIDGMAAEETKRGHGGREEVKERGRGQEMVKGRINIMRIK